MRIRERAALGRKVGHLIEKEVRLDSGMRVVERAVHLCLGSVKRSVEVSLFEVAHAV